MTDIKKLRKLAEDIRNSDFESEDFNDTLLIDHVVASGGTMRIAFEAVKPLRDFIAACNPQAIIELLDRLERYEKALEHYESAHYTISGFPCDHDGVAREALEGGKP